MATPRKLRYRRSRPALATAGALMIASGVLAACSSDDGGENDLVWYINPDAGGQDEIAANCSLALGGSETVTPMEMARAYAAFAGRGRLPHNTPPVVAAR